MTVIETLQSVQFVTVNSEQDLSGHMRQRVKRAIRALADNPRPSSSKDLDVADLQHEIFQSRRVP